MDLIVTFSRFLLYARYPEADRAAALKKFVAWSLHHRAVLQP